MRGRGKVTPSVRARIIELRSQEVRGRPMSERAIVAALAVDNIKVSSVTVHNVIAAAKSGKGAARGESTPRRGRGKSEGTGAESGQVRAPSRTDLMAEIHKMLARPLPKLPDDASEDLKGAMESLVILRHSIYAELEHGDYSLAQITTAIDKLDAARERVRRLRPPTRADVNRDLQELAEGAEAAILDRIIGSIESVERRAGRLCPRCRAEVEAT